jgi:hypothetical protein
MRCGAYTRHWALTALQATALAAGMLGAALALAQSATNAKAGPGADCPAARDVRPQQLHGLWSLQFIGVNVKALPPGWPSQATVLLEQHAEFSESLGGGVRREITSVKAALPAGAGQSAHTAIAQLAGDLEDGVLTLDESSNGTSITATWNAEIVEASCGRQIKGVWQDTSDQAPADAPAISFVLIKRSGV